MPMSNSGSVGRGKLFADYEQTRGSRVDSVTMQKKTPVPREKKVNSPLAQPLEVRG